MGKKDQKSGEKTEQITTKNRQKLTGKWRRTGQKLVKSEIKKAQNCFSFFDSKLVKILIFRWEIEAPAFL